MTAQDETTSTESTRQETSHTPALLEAITKHPFFKGLTAEQLSTLAECAMLKKFEENELICKEQEPANRFYLIQEGKVALESEGIEGETVSIQTISAGEVLGWSWLFPPYHWHFNARATEETRAIFFYGTRLREWCDRDHDLGYELIQRMAAAGIQRLQSTRRRLVNSLSNR